MSLRINHKPETIEDLRDEIADICKNMLHPPQRKASSAPLGVDKHCIRVQKMFPNEQLAVAKFDKIEFTANGVNYEGKRLQTAEFPDELILIVGELQEKK